MLLNKLNWQVDSHHISNKKSNLRLLNFKKELLRHNYLMNDNHSSLAKDRGTSMRKTFASTRSFDRLTENGNYLLLHKIP